ncbi:MAG: membrane integrity-associated transporter subunit PqiC [Enterobacteriaceae bacterium]
MVKNKWWLLVSVLLLAACSTQVAQKKYYQLPEVASEQRVALTSDSRQQLQIDRVVLSDYLNGAGIVYQSSDVQYVMANSHLWASPLEQQLRFTLQDSLTALLPGWQVSLQPLQDNPMQLSVRVTGFHGRYDGQAVIRGEWQLTTGQGKIVRQTFNLQLPQSAEGYDVLVKTLAAGWQQEAGDIARQATHLMNAKQ